MAQRTQLYNKHCEAGAKWVDFGGWDMPIHYGSLMEEHHAVRTAAGMFDVSHMTVIDFDGAASETFLRFLLANDVAKLKNIGDALYSAMLNEQGGVIDDLIVYRLANGFRMVVNAGTRAKDLAWIAQQAQGKNIPWRHRDDLSILAVQGPKALELLPEAIKTIAQKLKYFSAAFVTSSSSESKEWFVARTGYTGEQGVEIILPHTDIDALWQDLLVAGVKPCGLGARDTLRLEAGMNLYGHEMDDSVSPLKANMGWTVAWQPEDRNFIGRSALLEERAQPTHQLVGLVLQGRGVLRAEQLVKTTSGEGVITSGTFSPTLEQSVALARLPLPLTDAVEVDIRGRLQPAQVVMPSFVRNGQKIVQPFLAKSAAAL